METREKTGYESKEIESVKLLTQLVPVGVIHIDILQQLVCFENKKSAEIFGISELSCQPMDEFIKLIYEKERTIFLDIINSNTPFKGIKEEVFRTVKSVKGYKWILFRYATLVQNNKEFKLICSVSDITDLRNADMYLKAYRKMNNFFDIKQQRIKAISILNGQELERKRISVELHDGVGQMLTALKLNIEAVNSDNFDEGNRNKINNSRDLVREIIQEVRRVSYDLVPHALYDFGLESSVKTMLSKLPVKDDFEIEFFSNIGDQRFEKLIEIQMYRIVQEAVNNAIRHSLCTRIAITINYEQNELNIEIKDNGIGFERGSRKNDIKVQEHNGINNMQMRAKALGANINIISSPTMGCTVKVEIKAKILTT